MARKFLKRCRNRGRRIGRAPRRVGSGTSGRLTDKTNTRIAQPVRMTDGEIRKSVKKSIKESKIIFGVLDEI